jgi:hypothetical protein
MKPQSMNLWNNGNDQFQMKARTNGLVMSYPHAFKLNSDLLINGINVMDAVDVCTSAISNLSTDQIALSDAVVIHENERRLFYKRFNIMAYKTTELLRSTKDEFVMFVGGDSSITYGYSGTYIKKQGRAIMGGVVEVNTNAYYYHHDGNASGFFWDNSTNTWHFVHSLNSADTTGQLDGTSETLSSLGGYDPEMLASFHDTSVGHSDTHAAVVEVPLEDNAVRLNPTPE